MLHVGGGAVDQKTGEVFRVVGETEGGWTVQAPGASEPLLRRTCELTPCALPPDDDDDDDSVVVM